MIVQTTVQSWLCRLQYNHDCADYSTIMIVQTTVQSWLCRLQYNHDCADYSTIMIVQTTVQSWLCRLQYNHDCADYSTIMIVQTTVQSWLCRLQYNHAHNYNVCSGTEISDPLTWCMHRSWSVRGYNLPWLWYKHYIEQAWTEITNLQTWLTH